MRYCDIVDYNSNKAVPAIAKHFMHFSFEL